jgi:ankyrin repeat protein
MINRKKRRKINEKNSTNIKDKNNLFNLIEKEDIEGIKKILNKNNKIIDLQNEKKLTPIALASLKGNSKIIKELIKLKANIESKNGLNEETPLMLVAQMGKEENEKYEIIKTLISFGADINSKDKNGYTILVKILQKKEDCIIHWLQEFDSYKKYDMVNFLIELKADINSINGPLNETPIMLAIKKYNNMFGEIDVNVENIEKLIKNGANLNLKNKENKTVMDILIEVMANYHDNIKYYDPIQIARLLEIYDIILRKNK